MKKKTEPKNTRNGINKKGKKITIIKKVVKTQTKKLSQKQETGVLVVDQSTLAPIKDSGKYSIAKTWISEKQIIRILQRTPKEYIYTRPAKGGGTWDYVPGGYIEKVLNYAFGWNWDFKIIKQECLMLETDHGQVITWGELTVKDDAGHQITKSQNGRADVKYKKGTKVPMDLGNDYKASATDCMKKCASMLGIASDVYGKQEFREIGVIVKNDDQMVQTEPEVAQQGKNQASGAKNEAPDVRWECHECGNPIKEAEAQFSKRIFGKPLCRTCQGIYKNNK
jgi:hypothetical protein